MAKYCVNCGSKLIDGMSFCADCGAKAGEIIEQKTVIIQTAPKSRIVAGLLGLFLGWLGVHNFYLGYTGKAVGQLLLSVLTCGVLSGLSFIWGLIEGIMILTETIVVDGKGNKLIN